MAFADSCSTLISELQGQSWSNFRNRLDDLLKDEDSDEPPPTRLKTTQCGKLDKADAAIYGICPELEELVLVDCRICSKIVKAEAIKSHYELNHVEAYKIVSNAVEENRISTAELRQLQDSLSAFTVKSVSTVKPVKQSTPGKPTSFKIPVSKSKIKSKKALQNVATSSSPELSPPISPRQKSSSPVHNKFAAPIPSPPSSQKNCVTNEAEKPTLEPVISLAKVEGKDASSENDNPLSPPQLTPQVHIPPLVVAPSNPVPKPPSKHKSVRSRNNNNSNNNIINNNNNNTSNSNNVSSKVSNNTANNGVNVSSVVISSSSITNNNIVSNPTIVKVEELDLEKLCGVVTDGIPCKESLSCKIHTLAMKQSVKGRSRKLEVFLADHISSKESAKKKKEIDVVVKATPDSTTFTSVLPSTLKPNIVQKPSRDTSNFMSSIMSPPPCLSPALPAAPSTAAKKDEIEDVIKKSNVVQQTVSTTNFYLQERTPMPFFKATSLKSFESLPKCYWPHHFGVFYFGPKKKENEMKMNTMKKSSRQSAFMTCYALMQKTKKGVKNVRYYTKNFPNSAVRTKKNINHFTSIARLTAKDTKPANPNNVKPLAVCTFNYQKCGGLMYSKRQVQLARSGLQSILSKTSTSNPETDSNSSTISYMLNSMSSKASGANRLVASKKLASRPLANSPKSTAGVSNSSGSLVKVSNVKSVLSQNTQKSAVKNVKNKQLHVPNILGNKRQSENACKGNSKKAKKKSTGPSTDMNASQLINDFFSKNSSLKQRKSDHNVPVLRFAIANGKVEASGEQKTVYSTSLIKDMKKIKPDPPTTSKPAVVGVQNTPVSVQQSSNGNDNFSSQQITYLTTSPVTFQQISLRMLNQLQLQGKSGTNTGNGTVKIVANPVGGTLVKVPQSLLFQDKNSSV